MGFLGPGPVLFPAHLAALHPSALLLHPCTLLVAVSLSELYVTWPLARPSGSCPGSRFLSAQPLPGSLQKLLSFSSSQMPSILFSPQGTLTGWRKAERLFTFLTGACFQFSHSCSTFQKEDRSQTDGLAATILSPRVTRPDPK